jgi:hypothetical protein
LYLPVKIVQNPGKHKIIRAELVLLRPEEPTGND